MARIRTIKPEFFSSEDIVCLSPFARLLYVALWCEADREGRLRWKPGTFKLRYLPADAVHVEDLCSELIARRLVVLYGEGLAYIPAFSKHQHVNPREAASTLPDPRVPDASPRVTDDARTVTDAQVGKERKGREGNSDPIGSGAAAPVSVPDVPTDPPSDRDMVFANGVPLLMAAAVTEKNARSFLAAQSKAHGDAKLLDALMRCAKERPIQPIPWLQATLGTGKTSKHSGFASKDYRQGIAEDGTFS